MRLAIVEGASICKIEELRRKRHFEKKHSARAAMPDDAPDVRRRGVRIDPQR